jgi:hypothetical protein
MGFSISVILKSETLYPTLQEEIGPAGPFMTEYRIELYQSPRKYESLVTVHVHIQAIIA